MKSKINFKTCLTVGIVAFLLFLAIYYWNNLEKLLLGLLMAALPLLIGAAIAYVVNIPRAFFYRHLFPKKQSARWELLRRGLALLSAYLTAVAVIVLLAAVVVPELIQAVQLLITKLIEFFRTANKEQLYEYLPNTMVDAVLSADWNTVIERVTNVLKSGIGGIVNGAIGIVSSVFSGIITVVVAIIFSLYIMTSREKLGKQINRLITQYLRPSWNQKLRYVLSVLNDSFHRYIVGQCMEALILGALCTVGMLIFRMPYAAMIGTLVGFTALIPVAGAYIGAGIGAFMILTVSPIQALWFLVFILILQQLEGNLIYPRVVGGTLGLPGLWVLAAVTVFGGLFGIIGMLLGVPVTATLYRLLRNDLAKRERLAAATDSNPDILQDAIPKEEPIPQAPATQPKAEKVKKIASPSQKSEAKKKSMKKPKKRK